MMPLHSALHIATAVLAAWALASGAIAIAWFSALFGTFYAGLGFFGLASGAAGAEGLCGVPAGLGLQPFDHPFHVLLGLLGMAAAWRTHWQTPRRADSAASTVAAQRTGKETR